jgi:hypothetical protein
MVRHRSVVAVIVCLGQIVLKQQIPFIVIDEAMRM